MSEEIRKFCFSDEGETVAIDFDGVIHNDDKGFHDGTVYGDPIAGAKEALKKLASRYRVIILSAKAKSDRPLIEGKTGIELIQEWLDKHDMSKYVYEITAEKPRAIVYIDDKAIRFEGSWEEAWEKLATCLARF